MHYRSIASNLHTHGIARKVKCRPDTSNCYQLIIHSLWISARDIQTNVMSVRKHSAVPCYSVSQPSSMTRQADVSPRFCAPITCCLVSIANAFLIGSKRVPSIPSHAASHVSSSGSADSHILMDGRVAAGVGDAAGG